MRRTVLTLSGTVAGLVALFSFKTHVPGAAATTAPATPSALSASAPPKPSPTRSASASKAPTHKPRPRPSTTLSPATTPASAPPSSAPPAPTTRTVTGAEEQTQYGPVQVSITVTGSHITNASGNLLGQGDNTSNNAIPTLNGEAVSAQSASIQAVSGATYTSNGYIQSLQSAIDQAGI